MSKTVSLRTRLFVLILAPLLLVALLLGYWRFHVAQRTANELFDRGLLAVALAISRDVAISEGDALSPTTRDLISKATGGAIFYHVTGPGGIYVTGYAYPPRLPGRPATLAPLYALAAYRGEPVRVLKMTERTSTRTISGETTVTVWQRESGRRTLARQLAYRAAALMSALLTALALVVWFGVELGLRPMRHLHDAIARRSADDLSQIRRPLPIEVSGIVATLNRLFRQVESSMQAHQAFISDAAHQLRNPAAAILSMAETLNDARDSDERARRTSGLIEAARNSARLTEQLLSLERLRYGGGVRPERLNLFGAVERACASMAAEILRREIDFALAGNATDLPIEADQALIVEAVKNLIDNALRHGGADLSRIAVKTDRTADCGEVTVTDDGRGLRPEDAQIVLGRFGQLRPGDGSGLGLSIVSSIAERHHGGLRINRVARGASLTLSIPLARSSAIDAGDTAS